MPFPIDTDFALAPTFKDLLNRTENHEPTHWFSTLDKYYYRDAYELFDIQRDPKELKNLVHDAAYLPVAKELLSLLRAWQQETRDPWICAPFAQLGHDGKCQRLDNGVPDVPGYAKMEL